MKKSLKCKTQSAKRITMQRTTVPGFTLIELVVLAIIFIVLGGIIYFIVDPVEIRQKARDAQRISDMQVLAQAVEQWAVDHNNTPPDANTTVRRSNQPATNPAAASGTGWIPVDLSKYIEKLPVDPKNTGNLIYRYYRSGNLYKIDATLEFYTSMMANTKDGGNDANHYEAGTGTDSITIP